MVSTKQSSLGNILTLVGKTHTTHTLHNPQLYQLVSKIKKDFYSWAEQNLLDIDQKLKSILKIPILALSKIVWTNLSPKILWPQVKSIFNP